MPRLLPLPFALSFQPLELEFALPLELRVAQRWPIGWRRVAFHPLVILVRHSPLVITCSDMDPTGTAATVLRACSATRWCHRCLRMPRALPLPVSELVHSSRLGHPFVATCRWIMRYGFGHRPDAKPGGARHAPSAVTTVVRCAARLRSCSYWRFLLLLLLLSLSLSLSLLQLRW